MSDSLAQGLQHASLCPLLFPRILPKFMSLNPGEAITTHIYCDPKYSLHTCVCRCLSFKVSRIESTKFTMAISRDGVTANSFFFFTYL